MGAPFKTRKPPLPPGAAPGFLQSRPELKTLGESPAGGLAISTSTPPPNTSLSRAQLYRKLNEAKAKPLSQQSSTAGVTRLLLLFLP